MTDQNDSPRSSTLQEIEAALERHRRERAGAEAGVSLSEPASERRKFGLRYPGWRLPFNPWFMFDRRHPVVRRITIGIAGTVAAVLIMGGAVWWRLASGPITLDVATPWLTAAIEQNLGARYRIQ